MAGLERLFVECVDKYPTPADGPTPPKEGKKLLKKSAEDKSIPEVLAEYNTAFEAHELAKAVALQKHNEVTISCTVILLVAAAANSVARHSIAVY